MVTLETNNRRFVVPSLATSYVPNHKLWTELDAKQLGKLKLLVEGLREFPSFSGYFSQNALGELRTEAKSFRGHIAGSISINHCNPKIALAYGVPQQDLQVMQLLNQVYPDQYNMRWAAKKIIQRLEGNFPSEEEKRGFEELSYTDQIRYNIVLVKTLLTTEALGLAKIDWNRVQKAFSLADQVKIDWKNDCIVGDFNSETGPLILKAIGMSDKEITRRIGGKDPRGNLEFKESDFDDVYSYISRFSDKKIINDIGPIISYIEKIINFNYNQILDPKPEFNDLFDLKMLRK